MKKIAKILLYAMPILIILLAGGYIYLQAAFPKVGPAPDMVIEITTDRVERGEYLAHHVMMCMECHAERDWRTFSAPPIRETMGAGGERFDHSMDFPGVFYSSNITPAGLADWTDGEIYRLITTGVNKDNKPMFPVMPYLNYGKMDPEDIKSVIAYLRTIDPIQASTPPSRADFPFNLILRTIPTEADPQPIPLPQDQLAYGEYLTNAAACAECHTRFEKGKFVGEYMAGGRQLLFPDGSILRTPNLTPHETGLKNWTREMFVQRFKMYVDSNYVPQPVQEGEFQTIMPWSVYAGMTTKDLEAIYTYLQSLQPVDNRVEIFNPAAGL